MTVSSIIPVNNYTGNSSTTQFDFDFLIEAEEELVVQHTDKNGIITTLTSGVDYSINETGNDEGSYITFPLSTSSYGVLGENETISLMLTLTIKQETEFKNSSYFNFTVLEWTFDYIVRILQILSRKIERCVKISEGSNSSADDILKILNDTLNICINSSESVSKSEEQISSYINTIENQISDFNSEYEDCYQNILDSDINTKLGKTQITNCILTTPSVADLSISDGVLTVAAGAEFIIPYGTSAPELSIGDTFSGGTIVDISWDGSLLFYIIRFDEDKTDEIAYTDSNLYLLLNANSYVIDFSSTYTSSGTTAPTTFTTGGYALWYDTSENYVKLTRDSGSSWVTGLSFPIGRAASDADSGYTKILQIFSASGFIDKTVWLNKNVTFLMPNGRKDDGTLKNIEYTTTQIYTGTLTSASISNFTLSFTLDHIVNDVYYPIVWDSYYYEQSSQPDSGTSCLWYNPETNIFQAYRASAGGWFEEKAAVFAVLGYDTTNACWLNCNIKNAFRAADYNDIDGNWTYKYLALFQDVTFAASATSTYDLSDYLPDDGKVYECLFSSYIRTGTTSGNAAGSSIKSNIIGAYIRLAWCVTRSSSYAAAAGNAVLPVGSDRSVTWYNQGASGTSGTCGLLVHGYRRVK